MKRESNGFWKKLWSFFGSLTAIVALLLGSACAYLLGSFFGMGFDGYVIGFIVGVVVVYGWDTIEFD